MGIAPRCRRHLRPPQRQEEEEEKDPFHLSLSLLEDDSGSHLVHILARRRCVTSCCFPSRHSGGGGSCCIWVGGGGDRDWDGERSAVWLLSGFSCRPPSSPLCKVVLAPGMPSSVARPFVRPVTEKIVAAAAAAEQTDGQTRL